MPTPKDMIIGKYYYTSNIDKERGISNKLFKKSRNEEQSDIYDTKDSNSGGYILKFEVDGINRIFNQHATDSTNYDEDVVRNTGECIKETCEACTISGGKKTRRKIKRKKPRKSIKNNKRKSSKK